MAALTERTRALILDRCMTGCYSTWAPPSVPPQGLEPHCQRLQGILQQCQSEGSSDTCVLIGGPGSGKNLAIRHCLRAAAAAAPAGARPVKEVYIYGSPEVDDQAVVRAILAALTDEEPAAKRRRVVGPAFGAVQAALAARTCMLVLRVHHLEHLSKNCTRTLYALADLLHRKLASNLVILATSRRHTILEDLDKRVRSRFAAQAILFPGITEWPVLRAALVQYLAPAPGEGDPPEWRRHCAAWQGAVRAALEAAPVRDLFLKALLMGRPFAHYKNVLWRMASAHAGPEMLEPAAVRRALPAPPGAVPQVSRTAAALLIVFVKLEELLQRQDHPDARDMCFRVAWDKYRLWFAQRAASGSAMRVLASDARQPSEAHAFAEFMQLIEAGLLEFARARAGRATVPLTHQQVLVVPHRRELKPEIHRLYPNLDQMWNVQATW